jgi:hypothetical protein
MNDREGVRVTPGVPTIIAGVLVGVGILLWMFVDKGFLIVAGLGAFGPGILRELGVLGDRDEFQLQSDRRAGYHAYLGGGLIAVGVVSYLEGSGAAAQPAGEWVGLVLLVLWLGWLFSTLMSYWGAVKTTTGILLTVGSFWALFGFADVLAGIGSTSSDGETLQGALAVTLLVVPWFLLAWTARRWPRATGLGLLGTAGILAVVFTPLGPSPLSGATRAFTATLLLAPLVACALGLLVRAEAVDDLEGEASARI